MPIDPEIEETLSLAGATHAVPKIDGRRPHVSTIWRWCKVGVRGIRLEHLRYGNRIVTTRQALGRFAKELAEQTTDAAPEPRALKATRTPAQRRRDRALARSTLESAGIAG